MPKRKPVIIIAVIIGALVLLAAGASLMVKFLVTPEMVRKHVLPRMEKALQRRIEMGDVRIGLFSGIGLRNLTVYERDGKEPFVSLKEASLRYQILPLLSRRLVVDEIVLDKPDIHVVRYSDGSFNFTDLLKKELPKTAESEKKTPFSFAVAKLSVTNGRVAYDDRKGISGSPFVYEAHDIKVSVKDLTPDHPFTLEFKAEVPGASFGYSGTVDRLKEGPVVDGRITVADTDLAKLTAGLPAGISATLRKFAPSGEITARIHTAGQVQAPLTLLKEGDIQLKDVKLTAGGQNLVLSGIFMLSNGSLDSKDFTVALGKNKLAIRMKTSPLDRKPLAVGLSADSDSLDLDALLASKKARVPVPVPPAHSAAAEPGPVSLPLSVNGEFRAKSVACRGIAVSGLALRYRLIDNVLNIDDMRGRMAGGTFSDTARIDLGTRGFSYTTRLILQGMQVEKLVAAFNPKAAGSVSGVLGARAELSGHGTSPAAIKRNIAGTGSFDVRNGKLTGRGFMSELARFLGSQELRVVRFSSFAGTYRIKGEQVFLDAVLNGSDIQLRPRGRIGFNKSLDMLIDTRIAPHITGKAARGVAGRAATDAQGWGALPIKATGTVDSPHFSLSGEILERRLKEKVGETIQKNIPSKEGISRKPQQLEKSLRGIFGK